MGVRFEGACWVQLDGEGGGIMVCTICIQARTVTYLLVTCIPSIHMYAEHASLSILIQYRSWSVPVIWYVTPAGPLGNPLLIHGLLYSVEFYKSDEENPDGPLIRE